MTHNFLDLPKKHHLQHRRYFLNRMSTSLGGLGLATLLAGDASARRTNRETVGGLRALPHHKPKAKRIIYLFQSGGPAQMDLYDYKPHLTERFGEEVPKSVYPDDRKTTMSNAQTSFPVAPSIFKFKQSGEGGNWLSETLPSLAKVADDLCIINSFHTDAINHDPAATLMQSGSQIPGRPSIGSWLGYGLGNMNANLPAFVAMSSRGTGKPGGQPLYDRLWGSGFLPRRFQGVKFRNQGDPVLDINNPDGVNNTTRRAMLDSLKQLNELQLSATGNPDIETRIAQYELAYRMQMSIPKLLDMSDEPQHVLDMYGADALKPGTYSYNCLIARRLAESGVRFIQLFHQGWDHHGKLPGAMRGQCRDTDQPSAALIKDLKQRGLFDDTIIVWGGEFGRTIYCQGNLTKEKYGRDHHPSVMSIWLAGGGIKGGITYGKSDDYSVNVAENGVHVHDLHATLMHLMGINHEQFTYRYQGRDFRLTDVHGNIVHDILS
ncbi:MAG: DUF1501 domain-containing protein [Planctomycetota bacterium]|nr:DUF1501 domain-containing protein [Planctomycetota bacterium]